MTGISSLLGMKKKGLDCPSILSIEAVEKWADDERDQLPLWLPVTVGVGIALWQYFGDFAIVSVVLFCGTIGLTGLALPAGSRIRFVCWVAAAGLLLGFSAMALKSNIVGHPVLAKVWMGEFYGRIEKVEKLSAREVVRLQLATDGHHGLPPKVRVNLSPEQYQPQFTSGAIISLRARLMPPAGPTLPGGYDFARRAWFLEIGATGTALGDVQLNKAAPSTPPLSTARSKLTQHVLDQMPANAGAIAAALVTGDQGHIAETDAQAMRDSGMAHLLSISGLHVTAVVGFIFFAVSRILSLSTWFALRMSVPLIAAGIAAVGAIGYTLLAGAEVPTVRSCVAALLVLTALAMGRDAITLRLVAFGALVVLIFWPEAMAGPSFQLSFAAVATIVALHELPVVKRWTERREETIAAKIWRGLVSLVLTGIAIEVVLAPIALYHFHKAGIYGALANVIAIPLTTFVIMPSEALALLADIFGAGAPFWWLAGQGIFLILTLAHFVSGLPGAISMMPAMPDWAFGAIIFGALIFGLLKTAVRFLGVPLFLVGVIGMMLAPRPDLLITGDGKHLALVSPDGQVALLRAKAGDYVRDMLLENAGTNAEPVPIEQWSGVACSIDMCVLDIERGGRRWSVLATRTPYQVSSMEMAAACKRVDIVASDRWLPSSCQPRWVKADRSLLEQSGGLAFYLTDGRLLSVNDDNAHMPWVKAAGDAKARAELD